MRAEITLSVILSVLVALLDFFQPFSPALPGTLEVNLDSNHDPSELVIWNISTSKRSGVLNEIRTLPRGWEFVNKDRGEIGPALRIWRSGFLELHGLTGRVVIANINSTKNKSAKVTLTYGGRQVTKIVPGDAKNFQITVSRDGPSSLVLRAVALSLSFLAISFIVQRIRDKPSGFLRWVFKMLPVYLVLIYVNVLWFLTAPGSFTGDAEIFIRESQNTVSDLVSPLFMLAFSAYYNLFPNFLGGLVLIQLYACAIGIYYFSNSMLLLIWKPKNTQFFIFRQIFVVLLTFLVLLNPVVMGQITLLYVDPLFYAIVLFTLGYFLRCLCSSALTYSNISTLVLLLALSVLFRHNSIFLLPVSTLMVAVLVKKITAFNNTLPYLVGRQVVAVTLFLAVVFLGRYFLNEVYVQTPSNYYIATPVYEVVGVMATFRTLADEDFIWTEDYMDRDYLEERYARYPALIPVLWVANNRGKLNLSSVYRDHERVWNEYLFLLWTYPAEFSFTKLQHFLWTLGVADFHLSPYFYDRLNKAYVSNESVYRIYDLGIYRPLPFPGVVDQLRKAAINGQQGSDRFFLSAAALPVLACLLVIIGFIFSRLILLRWSVAATGFSIVSFYAVSYASSYLVFSHGAFVKYGLLNYMIGLLLIVILTAYVIRSLFLNIRSRSQEQLASAV